MVLNLDNNFGGMKPCRIADATGKVWSLVFECDTETGRIERYVPDPVTGRPYLSNGELVTETIQAPAPLEILPMTTVHCDVCGCLIPKLRHVGSVSLPVHVVSPT